MLLTFDMGESLRPNTRVRDASGHRHAGRVLVQDGARIASVNGWFRRGAAYRPARGQAIIEVPDSRGVDPHRRSFVFGAAVRTTHAQLRFGSNVVQKGYHNQLGGQYKLQLDSSGVPSCVVRGSAGRVMAVGPRSVANGSWHRVSCTRTRSAVALRIDGKVRASVRAATGRLANSAPVRIGGKRLGARNDQYRGRVDSVYLRWLSPR
jgi:hypothetical protein